MAKVKISELPELNIATLDSTYVAGIYNDTTYKIAVSRLTSSLDTTFATDLVVNAISGTISTLATTASLNTLSTSVDSRLDTLETFSSSADNRYVLSGSITQTTWDNIANKPNDIVSSSTQISALGFVTGSYTTLNSFNNLTQSFNSISQSFTTISGSFGSIDFSGINAVTSSYLSFTQSYYSASASFDSRVTTEKNRIDAILSASNANSDTFAEVVSLINSVDLTNDNAFATFYTASNSRITSLENATSSYLTSLNGAISSSAQVLNGSGIFSSSTQLPTGLISSSTQLPSNLISGSSQISTLGFITGSYISSSTYSTDSASFDTRINSIVTESGSNLTYFIEAYASETYTLPGGFTNDPCRYSVVSATENVPSNWFNTSTYRFTPQKAGYWEIIASYDVYRNTEASMAIRKNGGIVASAGSFNAVAQDISKIIYLNGSTDYIDIVNTGGAALQRDQYQQRSWFQAKFVGVVSGSTDLLSANNTFTGTNVFSGSTTLRGAVTIGTGSGFEGGEILLAYAQGGSTSLTGSSLVVDVYADKLRIFESGGNARGAYLDLTKQAAGVGSEILTKASGFVNRGVDVTLGNLKARIAATGNVALQLSTVSGTYSVYGSSVYSQGGVAGTTIDGSSPKAISTTPAYLNLGYNFGTAGATDTWNIMDTSNSIAWRITMILGAGVNNNLVSIERLH